MFDYTRNCENYWKSGLKMKKSDKLLIDCVYIVRAEIDC